MESLTAVVWPSEVTAVGTGFLAFVGAIGLVVANTRVRRATAALVVHHFWRPGGSGVTVRAEVRATGLGRIKLQAGEHQPTITVTEIAVGEKGEEVPLRGFRKEVLAGEVCDPGEVASATETFFVPAPSVSTAGWQVVFRFSLPRLKPSSDPWYWTETAFLPAPQPPRATEPSSSG